MKVIAAAFVCGELAAHEKPRLSTRSLLTDDASTLDALEAHGFAFDRLIDARMLDVIARAVRADVDEVTSALPPASPKRAFRADWITRGRWELVGVVNRIDRRVFEPSGCGEVRLVYRLSLKPRGRPRTRLPMTLNVRMRQPKRSGDSDCRAVADAWLRGTNLVGLLEALPPDWKVEINYQSIHVPSTRPDMDDNAAYVLRAFRVEGDDLVADRLFNMPRTDLDGPARDRLVAWIASHLSEIDAGSAVVPDEFLATRAVSISPRGLVHDANRPFSVLTRAAATRLAELPLDATMRTKTPELLLRRLDEGTCVGCHQTRGVAGFHLLGEERDANASFNALAVGKSPHLAMELAWRAHDLGRAARGEAPTPRPFAAHPEGRSGDACGLVEGLSSWRCNDGLVCRDVHHADWGVCAPQVGGSPGAPCEDVTLTPDARAEGPLVRANEADKACPAPDGDMATGAFCAPNWLGFTGGMCSERCPQVGETNGARICAPLPSAGYEAECFSGREPPEACLARHYVTAWVALCDSKTPCRDDYGCARVPGAPASVGACVPPYFILQARVDGPAVDR